MKIRITKKKGSVTLRFEAGGGSEGVDLKDIILGAAKKGLSIASITDELLARGYTGVPTKDTPNVKEFKLAKPRGESPNDPISR